MYYPARQQALIRSKVDTHHFICEKCQKVKFRGSVQVDHTVPVVGKHGFVDWNTYIDRLFCSTEKLVVLCIDCHQVKTRDENDKRKANRASQKTKYGSPAIDGEKES